MSVVEHSGKQVVPLWINGQAHPLDPSLFLPVVNAISGETVHYAQGATVETAQAACEAAAAAFPQWSRTRHTERREMLFRAASLLESRAGQLADMQVLETSCNRSFGLYIPKLACEVLREIAAQLVTAVTGEIPPLDGDGYAFVMREAIGPVAIIPPWNSPTVLGPRGIAAALAAGCTVVLKASELCPRLYAMLVAVFEEAGLPRGCLNQVQAARENAAQVTEAIVSHPAIRKIEFVGSAAVGSVIGQLAAKHLKPILMELGGKGPAIVLKDANLPKAAKLAVFGAFLHHGQICMSTERIIVVRDVADEFVRLLRQEVQANWSSGQAGSAGAKSFAEKTWGMIDSARRNGAEYVVGDNSLLKVGGSAHATGLTPTIVSGVGRADALRDNESFGPSASLYVVADADEAVAVANDSAYGLNAAIWTEDAMLALDLARRLEYGQVHVNSTTINDPATMPISGVKASGWGDANSTHGIGEWLVNKSVTLRRSDEPIAFGAV